MCGNTKKVTNITQTGLGDAQYDDLVARLAQGGVDIDALGASLEAQGIDVDKLLTDMGTANLGITNLQTGQTDLSNRLGYAGTDNDPTGTGLYGAISGLGTDLTDYFGTGLTNAQDALSGQIGTGFDNVGGRFDTVDTNMANNRTAMDTGFSTMGGRFDTVDTNMADNRSAMDTGFSNVGSAFDAQNTGLEAAFNTAEDQQVARADALGGQMQTAEENLADRLSDLSGNQDTYYGDLAANQATMQDNQANYQSSFDNYVQRYGEDIELANQARADLQTGLVNTAGLVRDDIGRVLQAQATGQSTLSDQQANLSDIMSQNDAAITDQLIANQAASAADINNLSQLTQGNRTATKEQIDAAIASNADLMANYTDDMGNQLDTGFNRVADSNAGLMANQTDQLGNKLDTGFNQVLDSNAGLMATQTDTLSNQMNNVRDLVSDTTVALDQGVRQQFGQLARAFDNSGRLLKNQILSDGSIVSRNMTPDGMMSENYFNSAGQVIGRKSFDVNNMLADAQRYTNP